MVDGFSSEIGLVWGVFGGLVLKVGFGGCRLVVACLMLLVLANVVLGSIMKPPKKETDSKVQAEWWGSPGVVYFFAAGNPAKAIKIGVAAVTRQSTLEKSVARRFKQIQTSNHETVELLGVIYFKEGKYPTRDAEILERIPLALSGLRHQ